MYVRISKHVTSYTNEISFNEVYIGKSTDTSRAEDNIYHGSSSYIMNHWQSLDFNENMSTNTAFDDVSWNDVSFFGGKLHLRSYLSLKSFISYLVLTKLRFPIYCML